MAMSRIPRASETQKSSKLVLCQHWLLSSGTAHLSSEKPWAALSVAALFVDKQATGLSGGQTWSNFP